MSGDLSGPGISREEAGQLAEQVLALAPMTTDRADELLAGWRARLDEDEAAAKKAASVAGPDWSYSLAVTADGATTLIFAGDEIALADTLHRPDEEIAPHIARYDPARALREVPGKRLVLDEHLPVESIYGLTCKRCVSWQDAPGETSEFGIAIPDPWPCVPVRSVAASWDV